MIKEGYRTRMKRKEDCRRRARKRRKNVYTKRTSEGNTKRACKKEEPREKKKDKLLRKLSESGVKESKKQTYEAGMYKLRQHARGRGKKEHR